ncbi:MAG: hypothetical protein ACRC9N_11345 [Aeromonas sp.]
MANALLFPFSAMSNNDPAIKALAQHFKKAGASVVQAEVGSSVRKASGIAYREITLAFADSQVIALKIKETGDVFEVRINKTLTPIRNQDDHAAAIKEMVKLMDGGRAAFQRKLAKQLVALPPAVKTATPKIEQLLADKRDKIKAEIADIERQLNEVAASEVQTIAPRPTSNPQASAT